MDSYLVSAGGYIRVFDAADHHALLEAIRHNPPKSYGDWLVGTRLVRPQQRKGQRDFKQAWTEYHKKAAREFVTRATNEAIELSIKWESKRVFRK